MLIADLSPSSFEKEIFEWKELVKNNGFTIQYSEIHHDIAIFNDLDEVQEWIRPQLSPNMAANFVSTLEPINDKIYIPYRRLILILQKI